MPNKKLEHINYNGTTYDLGVTEIATQSTAGLMSASDKQKLDNIEGGSGSVHVVNTATEGVKIATIVINGVDNDIYAPEDTNTVYTLTTTGTGNAVTNVALADTEITVTKGATYNNYIHPAYTSHEEGLYKTTIDTTGHVSGAITVSKADITALGIPGKDTTYTFTKSGSGNALTGLTVSGTTITFSSANYNNYSHPTYTSQELKLYKVGVDTTGHVSSTAAVTKSDITALGIPDKDTTYTVTTTGTGNAVTAVGLSGTTITVTKGATYNNYSHPTFTSQDLGLYKVKINEQGHVNQTSAVSKADITALGIPGQDTTYTFTKSGTGNALTGFTVSGTTITFNSTNYNNYSHPAFTSQELGLYKVAVNNQGHVSSTSAITKADITGLGIPGENTTYTFTTTGTGNAVTGLSISGTTVTLTKGASYNNYVHPTFTSQESGLYKITVNENGHVNSVTTVSKADITALGIPSQNTTYTITTTGTGNAVTAVGLSGTTITVTKGATYNNYSHPTFTSQDTGFYKVKINEQGHVSSTTAVSKADITALGIPGQDTTYTFTKSGTGNALTGFTISGTTITFNSANYNNYSHPTFTSQEQGLYKIGVNTQGHVNSTATVSKADITALGIPAQDTTYTVTTTGTGNAVTAVGLSGTTITVTKGATYNNYSHPTYTSQELGLYKIQVDTTGHVKSTSSVTIADHEYTYPTGTTTMTTSVQLNFDTVVTGVTEGQIPQFGATIPADDITAWTTNTPTAVTPNTVVTDATFNTVVTGVTFGGTTVTSATVSNKVLTLTLGQAGSITTGASGSKTTGPSASVTAGTAANLKYTSKTIPNVINAGTMPTFTTTDVVITQPVFTVNVGTASLTHNIS